MKEDLINKLVETFKEETEKISNSLDGVLNFKFEEFFKKNNPEKGYHSIDALIIFKNFTLKLEYKINISMLVPKSTIEMRFMFEQAKLPVEYSIYDVLDVIDENDFKLYTFPYVSSETKMKEVLKYLVDTFKEYKDKIENISEDNEQITVLEKNIEDKINILLDEKIFESRDAFYLMHMLELYYVLDVSRFTLDSYLDYIKGNYKKAIKKYNKLGNKTTAYEQRLVKYMKNNEVKKPIEDNLNTLMEAKKFKNTKMEFIPMFLSWLVLTPVWCIIYDFIFYIALYFLSKDAIYVGGVEPLMLFMPAFITAIINSFFIRKHIYKLFFRRDYEKIIALDEIENGNRVENLMSKLFQFIIAMGVIASILVANTNIAFYEGYFKNNLKLLDITGEAIAYEDVECVYKSDGFKNGLGQIVNYPTYVIVLKGGIQIDLSYNMENADIQQNVIPLFKENNIEIRVIDLVENIERDIQEYTESQE